MDPELMTEEQANAVAQWLDDRMDQQYTVYAERTAYGRWVILITSTDFDATYMEIDYAAMVDE